MSATPRSLPPVVSVVVPMLNESGQIERCLAGFADQTYDHDLLDVIVVDGGSTDGSTEWVDAYSADHGWCRRVENPARKAAAAFNRGVEVAKGEIVVLFSAHGEPARDYVEQSVATLIDSGAAGVGGQYHHRGDDPRSTAIGLAMMSPFGMASPHRRVTRRAEVDTISHPAYWISAMREVGGFDETLERNSDYEFNHRMRTAGFVLVVDPSIESTYHPRASLRALARQFWWYGRWKERVVRRHPGSLKPRHIVPPATVAAAALVPLWVRGPRSRRALATGFLGYAAIVLIATGRADVRRSGGDPLTFALSLPIMHGCWGSGFLTSLVEDAIAGRS